MEAYALVDNSVRRKMDEMLKTWKEPVPGSMDTRPVFPPDVTRPIENALIKARTSAVQAQQEHMRNQQQFMGRGRPLASPAPYQQTPTPPTGYRQPPPAQGYPSNYPPQQYQTPAANAQQYQSQPQVHVQQYQPPAAQYQTPPPNPQYPSPPNGQQYHNQATGYPQHSLPAVRLIDSLYISNTNLSQRPPSQQYPTSYSSTTAPSWQQPPAQMNSTHADTINVLNRDIEKLITTAKAEWALNEYDADVRTRLKALLDLQTILQSQTLPPDQIALIKEQVAQLSASAQPLRLPSPPPAAPVVPPQQPTLNSILGPGALQALLARQSATPQPQVTAAIQSPQAAYSQPSYQPPAATVPVSTPTPDPNALLERLRAAGMLPQVPAATTPAFPPGKFPGFPPPPFLGTPPSASRTPLASIPNDVVLKPTSLKM
jgi:pre-mRNA cleavage complex 2 protein Pcf11